MTNQFVETIISDAIISKIKRIRFFGIREIIIHAFFIEYTKRLSRFISLYDKKQAIYFYPLCFISVDDSWFDPHAGLDFQLIYFVSFKVVHEQRTFHFIKNLFFYSLERDMLVIVNIECKLVNFLTSL